MKIAFIGAGSIGFTRELLADILTVPEFRSCEIAFTDINERNLSMVTQLCQRDIEANGLDIRIQSTLDRRVCTPGPWRRWPGTRRLQGPMRPPRTRRNNSLRIVKK